MKEINGMFIMNGLSRDNPYRIKTWTELIDYINEIGFLPLFENEIKGFSVEEHVSSEFWWTGDKENDPWEWREIIASSHEVAYGKFFDKKAGFISKKWLPVFANYRRNGYDFDSAWIDSIINRREKLIMDFVTDTASDGDVIWEYKNILSTDLKKKTGFGKGGEKNFPGITTSLMMKLYLVTSDFRRRTNKNGAEYGMSVSVLTTPESIWGYDLMTSDYQKLPSESWEKIVSRIRECFSDSEESDVQKVIGKSPDSA